MAAAMADVESTREDFSPYHCHFVALHFVVDFRIVSCVAEECSVPRNAI